jgi:hypothetical protein
MCRYIERVDLIKGILPAFTEINIPNDVGGIMCLS